MKMVHRSIGSIFSVAVVLSLLTAITTCAGVGNVFVSGEDPIVDKLPPDEIADTERPLSDFYADNPDMVDDSYREGGFAFKTMLTTQLDLKLDLFDLAALDAETRAEVTSRQIKADFASNESNHTTVQLESMNGDLYFAGKANADGTLKGRVSFPGHKRDFVLTLNKTGYHQRRVQIRNLAAIKTIRRTMAMAKTAESMANNALADSDGDLIPDVYDAFPNDADRAFSIFLPAPDDAITVAFEDNFPGLGDGDYNDFVAKYTIIEIKNATNQIVEIRGSADAIARVAGYDHRFGMMINFQGNASLDIQYNNYAGVEISSLTTPVTDGANIVIFERTKQAFTRLDGGSGVDNGYLDRPMSSGHNTTFVLNFEDPIEQEHVDTIPFDPYLYVHNTGYDVHLVGKPSLPTTNNPAGSQGFVDANGYPRGLLVPAGWAYPKESNHIENAYAQFTEWREGFGQTNSDWYFFPEQGEVVQPEGNFPVHMVAQAGQENTLVIEDEIELVIPACALSQDTIISIVPKGALAPSSIQKNLVLPSKAYDLKPDGLQFNCPVDLEITYNEQDILGAGLNESELVLLTSENGELFSPIGVERDSVLNTVAGQTTHFTLFSVGSYPTGLYARNVFVSNDEAFVAAGAGVTPLAAPEGGLRIIDVSIEPPPGELGFFFNDAAFGALAPQGWSQVWDVFVASSGGVNTLAYVADSANGLMIVDVSDSSAPTLVSQLVASITNIEIFTPLAITVVGGNAYIANAQGFVVVDVAVPTSMQIRDFIATDLSRNVAVVGSHAYVAASSFLGIVDISDPDNLVMSSQYIPVAPFGGPVQDVVVNGNYAYLAIDNGIEIVDISVPGSPVFAGSYVAEPLHLVNGLFLDAGSNFLYSATSTGLDVADITDPINLVEADSITGIGNVEGVHVVGNRAYLAKSPGSLEVIALDNVGIPGVEALYSNAPDWNDYIQNDSGLNGVERIYSASDSVCTGSETFYDGCFHGGELRLITIPSETDCSAGGGITASDNLDAFEWICDDSTGEVRIISTGLKNGKHLSDLLDFSSAEFLDNFVTVSNGTVTTPSKWWSNSVQSLVGPGPFTLSSAGTVSLLSSDLTTTVDITAFKTSLVVEPGFTLTGPGSGVNVVANTAGLDHLWIEGTIVATGDLAGINLNSSVFSTLRDCHVNGGTSGIKLTSSNANRVQFSSATNATNGIEAVPSVLGNLFMNITATSNSNGIRMPLGFNSVFTGVFLDNNGVGLSLSSSNRNLFQNITINLSSGLGSIFFGAAHESIYQNMTVANSSYGHFAFPLSGASVVHQNILFYNNTTINFAIAGGSNVASDRNTILNLVSANSNIGVQVTRSSFNNFQGLLKVGGNTTDCVVDAAGSAGPLGSTPVQDPGLTGTCTPEGVSSFSLSGGVDLTDTFVDSLGNLALALGDTGDAGVAVALAVVPPPVDGNDTTTHRWEHGAVTSQIDCDALINTWDSTYVAGECLTTFLNGAVEIMGDKVGNENGLCESEEICLLTPNIGGYQGHGNIISVGSITTGSVSNVELKQYDSNGL